jgi:general secretion pathway protein A
MYLDYYGLDKEPFHITPDPEFLFLSESHKQALGSIIYGIEKKKGFVVITGEVGVGKTMIVRAYLEQTRGSDLRPIYVFHPNVSFRGLLRIIYEELDLVVPETEDLSELVFRLYSHLIEEFKAGHTVALIVDEAQNMPIETLENLRMISNLESIKDKLIQIVLVGQPEFDRILDKPELKQLQQRISVRTTIAPLSKQESEAYIHHRLMTAGLVSGPVFEDGALRLIIRAAKGTPRMINILCDNALVTGCGYGRKPVTRAIVREVIDDFQGTKKSHVTTRLIGANVSWSRVSLVLSGFAIVALLMIGAWKWHSAGGEQTMVQPIAKATLPPAPSVPSAAVPSAPAPSGDSPASKKVLPPVPEKEVSKDVPVTVKKGDKLRRLVLQVYSDQEQKLYGVTELMNRVKKRNGIRNHNHIEAGKVVIFPRTETAPAPQPGALSPQ